MNNEKVLACLSHEWYGNKASGAVSCTLPEIFTFSFYQPFSGLWRRPLARKDTPNVVLLTKPDNKSIFLSFGGRKLPANVQKITQEWFFWSGRTIVSTAQVYLYFLCMANK